MNVHYQAGPHCVCGACWMSHELPDGYDWTPLTPLTLVWAVWECGSCALPTMVLALVVWDRVRHNTLAMVPTNVLVEHENLLALSPHPPWSTNP